MKDKEIVKALEYAKEMEMEDVVIYYEDVCTLLDIINRLQAEIERLKIENRILSQKRVNLFERLEIIDKAKTEAYKEFAERLKEKYKDHYRYDEFRVRCLNIQTDNILKEMVGEDE